MNENGARHYMMMQLPSLCDPAFFLPLRGEEEACG